VVRNRVLLIGSAIVLSWLSRGVPELARSIRSPFAPRHLARRHRALELQRVQEQLAPSRHASRRVGRSDDGVDQTAPSDCGPRRPKLAGKRGGAENQAAASKVKELGSILIVGKDCRGSHRFGVSHPGLSYGIV
jgi:hypothetical protein